ncbi:uridine kinase [Mucilaginibacter rubeus]|uniref:Uridine kinase n=1 Tax=Mucilaginibacter rubeus TaxID=2027860 RepID=A0AAE6JFG4_9SPHI|nr:MULTISPECIES: uridine kinase [Mucilaginibacter]QEM04767.1 uridine kinase [Mucilaginibacter rubeus]QEM17361.1 uridine kinase [Mucilaginibacter gossypii]QTE46123.1 uridine kinase [Mucilaginibacter rubeus]QTE52721.1 uridine kinase [Mucilaginibacter rubeus]QTE57808.1 uridine kinase [Mucilaginibacter rubeus]
MNKPYIIGIAGGSGSGKTFFLKCFLEHFTADEVSLVSQDDYYIPVAHNMTKEENKEYNFDLPSTIDHEHFQQDISKLLNKEAILKQEYTFNNPDAIPKMIEIKPAPILIVEGLFILHFKDISELLDLKVFIDADEDVALQRRLKRDLIERGYSHDDVMYKWINHVVPAYKEYLLPYKDECDRVITNNTHVAEDIMVITEEISADLRGRLF